jgi:hypothetical protein
VSKAADESAGRPVIGWIGAGRAWGVPLTMTILTQQMIQALSVADYAEEDFFAAVKLLERRAGLRPLDNEPEQADDAR